MNRTEQGEVVRQLVRLLDEHYVFPEVAAALSGPLSARTTATPAADGADAPAAPAADGADSDGADGNGLPAFAAAVTGDLQSVNGDRHLRLIHHPEALPEGFGEDDVDIAWMRRWADSTCGGIARVQRLPGNVGYLDIWPVLFPPAVAGDAMCAAMNLLSGTEALLIDLR
jgi:hypothetical protein